VFSAEEVLALVRAARPAQDGVIYLAAAFTGLRMGELLALRWRDVDFPASTIRVQRSYTQGVLGTPKSGLARPVPMVPAVAEAMAKLGQRERFTRDDDLVFAGTTGDYLDASALRRRFKRALSHADLRDLRFHDLRHTFGSLAIQRASILQVQAWMGHANIATTQKYLHHKSRADEARLLADAFAAAEPVAS
jgi:integrase